ncbi:MAG: hypothetical protein M9944_12865 [Rhizobiaceae bacterium]|nr:hypothetical protein [Rhizobiaceae bacterium]
MFVAQYRNTERGAQAAIMRRLEQARADKAAAEARARLIEGELANERMAKARAQAAAWKASLRLSESAQVAAEEAAERAQRAAEIRASTGLKYKHTFAELERRTCQLFQLSKRELYSSRRHRSVAFARQFLMYWASRLTGLSLPKIGRMMGNRDHTTILHGKKAYVEKRAYRGRYLRPVR